MLDIKDNLAFFSRRAHLKSRYCVPQKPSIAYLESRAPHLKSRYCVPQKPLGRTSKAVPAYLKSRQVRAYLESRVLSRWLLRRSELERRAGDVYQVAF